MFLLQKYVVVVQNVISVLVAQFVQGAEIKRATSPI